MYLLLLTDTDRYKVKVMSTCRLRLVEWLGDMHAMLCFQLERWLNGLAICMQCFVSNWSVG